MELSEIRTALDVYEFINEKILYGWLDIYGNIHLKTMKEFRRIYRTMSIDEILEHRIGTCIDQVNLMHYLLDRIGVKNKMFCWRIFEPDDYGNLEEEEHMHCFVLYYENGKVYRWSVANKKLIGKSLPVQHGKATVFYYHFYFPLALLS